MNNRHSSEPVRPDFGKRFPTIPLATISLVALALLASGTAALADPIRIVTSGNVYQLVEDGETGFTLVGADFFFSAGEVSQVPIVSCSPCVAGSSLNLSSTMTAQGGPGSATIDGRTYGSVYFGGDFTFNAGSVIVPDVPVGSPGIRPTTTFTFTGTLFGFADPARTGAPLFSTELAGSGTASLGFFNYETNQRITSDGFSYEFEAAEPTPEPGSMLLFGTGAAWMVSKYRKRRANSPTS